MLPPLPPFPRNLFPRQPEAEHPPHLAAAPCSPSPVHGSVCPLALTRSPLPSLRPRAPPPERLSITPNCLVVFVMGKDSHQGVKGQAETFKLDPICVLNRNPAPGMEEGGVKGMQRLESRRCPLQNFSWTPSLSALRMCLWPWGLGFVLLFPALGMKASGWCVSHPGSLDRGWDR